MKKAENSPIRAKRFVEGFTKSKRWFLEEIAALIDRIESLMQKERFSSAFKEWKREVNSLLCFALGDASAQMSDFDGILYRPYWYDSDQSDSNRDHKFRDGLRNAKVVLTAIQKEVEEYFPPDEHEQEDAKSSSPNVNSKNVFIVHGHDDALRLEVEKVLRKLGLNPIVLKDTANEGMTLIQKFEREASDACFVVVLLTADEDATVRKTEKKETHARQNVVFEMGYFFNAFKRKDGSHRGLCAILEEGVTKPGDIDGLVYCPYRKGEEGWILPLVKEIKAAGIPVDANKLS